MLMCANRCGSRWLALGANTGSVYLFQRGVRGALQYRQMAANNDGDVAVLAFAPNDNLLAVGTAKGTVLVLELNLDSSKEKTKVGSLHPAHPRGPVHVVPPGRP
jgi:hypothetical protein